MNINNHTDPQATKADQGSAKRVLYLAHISHDIVSSFKDAGIFTCKCGFTGCRVDYETHKIAMAVGCVALELAKVRQQGRAEMQAVCVKLAEESRDKACPSGYGSDYVRGAASSLHAFATRIKALTLDGTNALEEMLRTGYTEAIDEQQEPMNCAHPHACLQPDDSGAEFCIACFMQDEAVAAVVEDVAKVVLKYMATYPKGARASICALAHVAAKTAEMIRALKPNAQQILAKRDKRVREEALREEFQSRQKRDLGTPAWGYCAETGCGSYFATESLLGRAMCPACRVKFAEARLREPMECGHPRACFSKRLDRPERFSDQHDIDAYCGQVIYCTACAQQRELREALGNLIRQMDVVHEGVQRVYTIAAIHGEPYSGPTYEKELEAARQALGEKG